MYYRFFAKDLIAQGVAFILVVVMYYDGNLIITSPEKGMLGVWWEATYLALFVGMMAVVANVAWIALLGLHGGSYHEPKKSQVLMSVAASYLMLWDIGLIMTFAGYWFKNPLAGGGIIVLVLLAFITALCWILLAWARRRTRPS